MCVCVCVCVCVHARARVWNMCACVSVVVMCAMNEPTPRKSIFLVLVTLRKSNLKILCLVSYKHKPQSTHRQAFRNKPHFLLGKPWLVHIFHAWMSMVLTFSFQIFLFRSTVGGGGESIRALVQNLEYWIGSLIANRPVTSEHDLRQRNPHLWTGPLIAHRIINNCERDLHYWTGFLTANMQEL